MKTSNFRIAILTLLTLLSTASAHAADDTGWSISAGIGSSQIKDVDDNATFSGNAFGLAAEFEYRFTPNFSLGFGGFSLGRADDIFNDVRTEIEVRGYDFFGRLIMPVSETAEVFGRLGAVNYFVDIEPGSVNIFEAAFGSGANEFGLGVDFARRENMAIRLEYRYYNGRRDESGSLLLAGFNYLF